MPMQSMSQCIVASNAEGYVYIHRNSEIVECQ